MEHKRLAEALLLNHPELGVAGVKVDQAHGRVEVLSAQAEGTKVRMRWMDYSLALIFSLPRCHRSGPKERHPFCPGLVRVAAGPGAKGTAHSQFPSPWDVLRIVCVFIGDADREDARHL